MLLIRRKAIVTRLRTSGANSPETAVTPEEAGVLIPAAFPRVTERLIHNGTIRRTPEGKYRL